MKAKKSKPMAPVVETATESDRNWRAEDALGTLTRAEEIRRDSKLMTEVEKARKEKIAELSRVKVEVSPKTIKGMK